MSGGNSSRIVRFGLFEVDLRAGELRRSGLKVKLQGQPLQLLAALLEHPGEVVTREELRSKLWAADTFVDFDHSLNAAVRRLRDALGETAENPRYVETVARRGYRFLVPTNEGMVSATAAVPPSAANPKWWRISVVSAVLLMGVASGWVIAHWPQQPVGVKRRRLTANPEDVPVLGSVISPDGMYVAFSDKTGFYLRQINTGETHPVTLPQGFNAVPAAWFPDGTHLVATWIDGPKSPSSLWQISVLGGLRAN